MLDVVVGLVVGLLVVTGIIVMLGPATGTLIKRARDLRRASVPSVFQAAQPREVVPSGLNPKTQRVLVAAARLGNWLQTRGEDDLAPRLRSAVAKITSNEPAGLYAMQVVLRRLRTLNLDDRPSQARLKGLTNE